MLVLNNTQALTEARFEPAMAIARASTPLLGKPAAGVAFNIISWNVNGLRALMKKKVDGRNPVEHLVRSQQPAILCLQETKINPENVDKLRESK